MAHKAHVDYSGMISYLSELDNRIKHIESVSKISVNETIQQEKFLENSEHKLKVDMDILRKKIDNAKELLESQKDLIRTIINEFKGAVSKERLDRLKEHVDQKNFEKYISRKEFKDMIVKRLEQK